MLLSGTWRAPGNTARLALFIPKGENMGTYTDRFVSHAVWKSLDSADDILRSAVDKEGEKGVSADALAREALDRLIEVIAFAKAHLNEVDPLLAELQALDALNAQATNIRTEIEGYLNGTGAASYVAANQHADALLITLSYLHRTESPEEATRIGVAIGELRKKVTETIRFCTKSLAENQRKSDESIIALTALSNAIEAEQTQLKAMLSEHQSKFLSAQDLRASEHSAAQSTRQSESAKVLLEFQSTFAADQNGRGEKFSTQNLEQQTTFSTSQEARARSFSDVLADIKSKSDAAILAIRELISSSEISLAKQLEDARKTANDNLIDLKSDYEVRAAKILTEVRGHLTQVEKLVGVIGTLGVTSGYTRVANFSRSMAVLWQLLTVASLGGLIWVAYTFAFPPTSNVHLQLGTTTISATSLPQGLPSSMPGQPLATSTPASGKQVGAPEAKATSPNQSDTAIYQGIFTRIFLSITCGIFAMYASRQATRFFETEQRNRKLALEFEALGPFIAPLPEAMQHEFRNEIGKRSFSTRSESADKFEPDPVTPIDALKSKDVRELLSEVIKAIRGLK